MQRTHWDQLPDLVRTAIRERTGPVLAASTATAGRNSALAAILHTHTGTVFVKGLPTDTPAHLREAAINPYVQPVSPPMLWHTVAEDWRLLGFAHVPGRHADYRPGSSDLPKVVEVMCRLAALPYPDLPEIKQAEQRWRAYLPDGASLALLRGETLLHTDYAPDNVLINDDQAHLIDWAWPTRGAAFIDPACLVVRLIHAGHPPDHAETTVAHHPAWATTPAEALNVFAAALARMWRTIADQHPDPWKQQMAHAADTWHQYRWD